MGTVFGNKKQGRTDTWTGVTHAPRGSRSQEKARLPSRGPGA